NSSSLNLLPGVFDGGEVVTGVNGRGRLLGRSMFCLVEVLYEFLKICVTDFFQIVLGQVFVHDSFQSAIEALDHSVFLWGMWPREDVLDVAGAENRLEF